MFGMSMPGRGLGQGSGGLFVKLFGGEVDLRQRRPVRWAVASLLPPVLFYWFHKSNRQINLLNRVAGRPQRIMNSGWLIGSLLALLLVTGLTQRVQQSAELLKPSESIYVSESGYEVVYEGPERRLTIRPQQPAAEAETPAHIAWLTLAWLVLYFNYLRQHLAGIKQLDDDPADRPLLTLLTVLAATVFLPAGAFVVYRSQVVLNWAIDQSLSTGSKQN